MPKEGKDRSPLRKGASAKKKCTNMAPKLSVNTLFFDVGTDHPTPSGCHFDIEGPLLPLLGVGVVRITASRSNLADPIALTINVLFNWTDFKQSLVNQPESDFASARLD